MMPPDWELFVYYALRIVALGIVVLSLHNMLKVVLAARFWDF